MSWRMLFTAWGMLAVAAVSLSADERGEEYFEKQVRPILVARCYECHSATAKRLEGNLRLDSHSLTLKGGDTGPAVVPGDLKKSLLIDSINYGETYQMPPKARLPEGEVAILTKWVEMGAPWPKGADPGVGKEKQFDLAARKKAHWVWQPIRDLPPPEVKNVAWGKQALDRFVLAKIEAAGFAPASAADKRTLLRRLYFDLIGLPPTVEAVQAFLQDDSPQAVEKVVEQLLQSPQFGERWGRHWLDLVRYAESRGHEFDYNAANAFQYRDYVIRALNADVPYDQFVTEHLAGDLLPQPRTNPSEGFNESILGTGFWFLGEWVHSPVDLRKDEADRFDNMVDVFSKTFLGMTVSCARCHDHKFDAISQQDYYALFGYLQSSSYRLARFDTMVQHPQIAAELAKLDAEFRPKLGSAKGAALRPVVAKLTEQLAAADSLEKLKALVGEEFDAPTHPLHVWRQVAELKEKSPEGLQRFARELVAKQAPAVEGAAKGVPESQVIIDFSKPVAWMVDGPSFGTRPATAGELLLQADGKQPFAGVQLFAAARRDPVWNGLTLGPHSENDTGGLGRMLRAGRTLRTPTFTLEKPTVYYLVKGTGMAYATIGSHAVIHGPLHGSILHDLGGKKGENLRWVGHNLAPYIGQQFHVELTAKDDEPLEVLMVVQSDKPPALPITPPGSDLALRLANIENASLAAWAGELRKLLDVAVSAIADNGLTRGETSTDVRRLADWLVTSPTVAKESKSDEFQKTAAEYAAASKAIQAKIRRDSRLALAMWDGDSVNERFMIRGNPSPRTLGPEVPKRLPTALEEELTAAGRPLPKTSGSGRLELAQRLLHPADPLPARVMVNRVWQHLFGRGIVPTADNFGVLGQAPTHPELLDHLAAQFRQEGWSLKRLIKSIVLSSTYQQSSAPAEASIEERDPENLLWRRTNVRRLEGEAIRDAMLTISGRLDRTQFGPAVPIFLNEFLQGRGRPGSGPLDGNGRRSVYLSVRRNFLSPMMLAYDTPIPFSTVGRRNVSNVPAQALILMNDPFVMEQGKLWAKRLLADKDRKVEERISLLYEQAFARPATVGEIAAATSFLQAQAAELQIPAEKALADERVWADLCHVLWNVKEFVFLH